MTGADRPNHWPDGDGERLDWLRLIRSENIGPITFWQLLDRFGSAARALEALPDLAKRGGRAKPVRIMSEAKAVEEWERHDALGARLLALGDPDYPQALAAAHPPPPLLSVRSRTELFARPAIAIVGARNASALGRRLADTLARDLGEEGITIVSGLARGIDRAAHEGALHSGTAAVLAGGIDHVYPPEHEDLAAAIAERGLLISEMPFGFSPQARHFPRRNRIVSGLSLGVVVVEAATRSGSLITARMALEQGREVFAVPGSPLDPRARGSNSLLRQGAVLTECAEDVLTVIRPMADHPGGAFNRPSDGPSGTLRTNNSSKPGSTSGGASEPVLPGLEPSIFQDGLPAADALSNASDHTRAQDTQPHQEIGGPQRREAEDLLWPLLGSAPVGADDLIRASGLPAHEARTLLLEWEISGRIIRDPGGGYCAAPQSAGTPTI